MAFLDNSGDIILDAVLTDAGRQRLSRGNFRITKFALGDEEINYSIFNKSHPSGSAFYDLEIMQTPILEAFTNNTSLMKSKLVTMTRNNILYMPIFKLNNSENNFTQPAKEAPSNTVRFNHYMVLADRNTELNAGASNEANEEIPLHPGVLRGTGTSINTNDKTKHIAVDQGIDSNEGGLSFRQAIPDDLVETAFLIKMDHRLLRLGQVRSGAGGAQSITPTANQFVDDDGIATYYVVQGDGSTFVEGSPQTGTPPAGLPTDGRTRGSIIKENPTNAEASQTHTSLNEMFPGPLGSILRLYPLTTSFVKQSSALFDELGTTVTSGLDIKIGPGDTAKQLISAYKFIDTSINIVGVTTGYAMDIPIRILKKS